MQPTEIRHPLAQAQLRPIGRFRALRVMQAWPSLVLAILLGAVGAAAHAQVSKEYKIKVAFLYNFTKFVEWPASSFARADSPFVIGLYCPVSVHSELAQLLKGRKVNGREIVSKRMESAAEAGTAQLLFVCTGEDSKMNKIRAAIGAYPVLLVSESDSAKNSATINFTLQDDKVRFEVNMADAERSDIKISAQLLKLAVAVRKEQ